MEACWLCTKNALRAALTLPGFQQRAGAMATIAVRSNQDNVTPLRRDRRFISCGIHRTARDGIRAAPACNFDDV